MILSRVIRFLLAGLLAYLPAVALAQGARSGIGPNPGTPIGHALVLPQGLEIAGPIVAPQWKKLPDGSYVDECPDGSRFPARRTHVQACAPACNRAPGTASAAFPPGLVIVSTSEGFQHGLLVERIVVRVPGKNCNGNTNAQPNAHKDLERKRRLAPDGAVWIPLPAYCLNRARNPTEPEALYKLGPVTTDAKLLAILKLVENRRARDTGERDAIQKAVYSATEPDHALDARTREKVLAVPKVAPTQ